MHISTEITTNYTGLETCHLTAESQELIWDFIEKALQFHRKHKGVISHISIIDAPSPTKCGYIITSTAHFIVMLSCLSKQQKNVSSKLKVHYKLFN